MNTTEYIKEQFEQLQEKDRKSLLADVREKGFTAYTERGIPHSRHEEWKYTRIGALFNKEYKFQPVSAEIQLSDLADVRLPGHESANELFFINGRYASGISVIRSGNLIVLPLEEAATSAFSGIVGKYLGHSNHYIKDGINSLSTALLEAGVLIHISRGEAAEHPLYIYNINDSRTGAVFNQPRSLVYLGENAALSIVETYCTLGSSDSFTNQVMEIVTEKDARFEYYKIQNDAGHTSQVSTNHIRQVGKSFTHSVTITLNGAIVRNNTNILLEADNCEAHMYGLYLENGNTHVDNHTIVDNINPGCYSNQLYKGILDGHSTGVFNGKIFVRQDAQKTNAFQSNKNVLLSDNATVNTKPQLEIFADDVKCSHGCTVGRLDDEGLFYLQSRGIPDHVAKALLLQGFASDIVNQVKIEPIRNYIHQLISNRLNLL